MTITGKTSTVTFNGKEQSVNGYDVSIPAGSLYKAADFTFNGTAEAKGTDVKTYDMKLSATNFTNNNKNFNVTFDVTDGWLKIEPLAFTVNITGEHDSQEYDGAEHTITGFTSNAPAGVTVTLKTDAKAEAKRTDAGTTYMGLTADSFEASSANYAVTIGTVTDGYMEITKKNVTVTITGKTSTVTFNGKEQSVNGYDVSIPAGSLYKAADFTFNGTAEAKGTDVKTYDMKLSATNFTNNNKNFNVTFDVTDGWLKIKPLAVTVNITGNLETKTFNGAKQSVTGYTTRITGDSTGLYKDTDVSFSGNDTVEGTNVGTYTMGLAVGQFTNTNGNFDVTFGVQDGGLTIDPLALTVNIYGNTDTQVYNGTERTVAGFTTDLTADSLYKATDFTFKGTAEAKGTDANTYPMNLSAADFTDNNNTNFKITFNIAKDGAMVVSRRTVILTSGGGAKAFDNQALTSNAMTVTGDGWVAGEGAAYTFTGAQTAEGRSQNFFTYTLNAQTKADNYNIQRVYGWLVVDPVDDPPVVPPVVPPVDPPVVPPVDPPVVPPVEPPVVEIEDEPVALAAGASWALLNLILTILTAIGSVVLLIGLLGKKKEEDEDSGEEKEIKKKAGWRWGSLIPTIASIIIFILTEDMSNPWVWVDKWTILMAIITVAQIVVMLLSKKEKDDGDDESHADTGAAGTVTV